MKSRYIKQNAQAFQELSLLKAKSSQRRQIAPPIIVKPINDLKQNSYPCKFWDERIEINFTLAKTNECQFECNLKTLKENSGKRF